MEDFKYPHNRKPSKIYDSLKWACGKNTGNDMKENCDVEYFSSPNYGDLGVSTGEKRILMMMMPPSPELPYPLQELPMWQGKPALEYVIPDNLRQAILEELYPFIPCPNLDDVKIDIHAQKTFTVREFKVIRELERNMLVSPYYAESGGMVVDWLDPDDDGDCIRRVKI